MAMAGPPGPPRTATPGAGRGPRARTVPAGRVDVGRAGRTRTGGRHLSCVHGGFAVGGPGGSLAAPGLAEPRRNDRGFAGRRIDRHRRVPALAAHHPQRRGYRGVRRRRARSARAGWRRDPVGSSPRRTEGVRRCGGGVRTDLGGAARCDLRRGGRWRGTRGPGPPVAADPGTGDDARHGATR